MKTVVIVSPHFPPSTLAGVHRARHLAKHLPKHGWRPVIVRVAEQFHGELPDPGLAHLLPSNLIQYHTGALPLSATRRFGLGDVGIRAYSQLKGATRQAVKDHDADVIMITGSPFYPMLMTKALTATGVPVILDFQDPWISAQGRSRSILTKGGISHLLSKVLEPMAVRHASFITSVSERQNSEMAARYPGLRQERMAAIPIGGDPEDYAILRGQRPLPAIHQLDASKINFTYVGTMLPKSLLLLKTLFDGLRGVRDGQPKLLDKVHFNFVGTSNQAVANAPLCVTPLAKECGVAGMVSETPQRVPYLQALTLLAQSNVLMMIGSDEPHYTASKIYPNLMAGRPFLSLFHANSSSHDILQRAGGGITMSFSDLSELARLVPIITEAIVSLATHPESFPAPDTEVYGAYSATCIAEQFAHVFERTSASPRGRMFGHI